MFEKGLRHAGTNPGRFGVGFVFSMDDAYCGIDLDHCRNPKTGSVEGWARKIIQALNSYAEVSPNGTEVKVIVRATLPDITKHKVLLKDFNAQGDGERAIEVYDRARFFTITGNRLDGTPEIVNEAQEAVDTLLVL